MDHNGRQYLVSAKHILADVVHARSVELFHAGSWKNLEVDLVGHAAGDIDISVCAARQTLTGADYNAEPTAAGMVYGQTVFFLGFPFGLFGDFPDLQESYPVPFVKSATLSMMGNGDKPIYLDGINNRGFSGGPVVWKPPQSGPQEPWRIGAVISGYKSEEELVAYKGQDLGHRYKSNTGLIRAFPIRHAVALAEANPIGVAINMPTGT